MIIGCEQWRPIPGHAHYEVSDRGRVRSVTFVQAQLSRWGKPRNVIRRGKILKPLPLPSGYLQVSIGAENKKYIHRLVLEAFVGPCPPGMESAHDDGSKGNNNLSNLDWKTSVANNADKVRHGTVMLGARNPMGRKTHCKRGHEFTEPNTRRANGKRICRRCVRERVRTTRENARANRVL